MPGFRNIADLEMQLEHERNRREKLEAKVDQYKLDIAYLTSQLDQLSAVGIRYSLLREWSYFTFKAA